MSLDSAKPRVAPKPFTRTARHSVTVPANSSPVQAGGGLRVQDLWLAALRAAGRSPQTLATYRYAVDGFVAWRHDPDLTTVSRAEAFAYSQYLGERFKPGGVALRLRSLRAMYGWLVKEEIAERNPFARMNISVPLEAKTTPPDEEIDAMLARAKCNRRDFALLTLLADTGCRKGEIAALTMKDIDLRSGVVRFPRSKTMVRTVPMTDRAVIATAHWLRRRGAGPGGLWRVTDPYSSEPP